MEYSIFLIRGLNIDYRYILTADLKSLRHWTASISCLFGVSNIVFIIIIIIICLSAPHDATMPMLYPDDSGGRPD